jgi:uncharacterized protein
MGGKTALQKAVAHNYKDIVELLLAHNADFTLKDNRGQTAVDLAIDYNLKPVVALFEQAAQSRLLT